MLRKAGILAATLLVVSCGAQTGVEDHLGAANVLLITLDTTRADFLGVYGHSESVTPHLDGLAARGVVFENAYSTAPFTGPAHASILTSQHPSTHGIVYNGHCVSAEIAGESATLAEYFHKLGFTTGAVVSSGVLHSKYGFDRGFETYHLIKTTQPGDEGGWSGSVSDKAIQWLEEHRGGRFFLWVHYIEPHLPYVVSSEVKQQLKLEDAEVSRQVGLKLPTERLRRSYGGDIFEADVALGRLLDYLASTGLTETTLMAVTSDHGEYLHEHGRMMDHSQLYDQVLHVPLIFSGPGLPQSERRSGLVSVIDVVPTILDALQLPPLPTAQGSNILDPGYPIDSKRAVFAEWRAYRMITNPEETQNSTDFLVSVQVGSNKLIRSVLSGKQRLFCLADDPLETNNLVDEDPELTEHLSTLLNQHITHGLPRGLLGSNHIEIDEESAMMLRNLGYIE